MKKLILLITIISTNSFGYFSFSYGRYDLKARNFGLETYPLSFWYKKGSENKHWRGFAIGSSFVDVNNSIAFNKSYIHYTRVAKYLGVIGSTSFGPWITSGDKNEVGVDLGVSAGLLVPIRLTISPGHDFDSNSKVLHMQITVIMGYLEPIFKL